MPSSSRKNEIKKAITRKPKYGGPQGGRPTFTGGGRRFDPDIGAPSAKYRKASTRVSSGSAVSRPINAEHIPRNAGKGPGGVKYLSRSDYNRNYEANGPIVGGPSLGTQMRNYKHKRHAPLSSYR